LKIGLEVVQLSRELSIKIKVGDRGKKAFRLFLSAEIRALRVIFEASSSNVHGMESVNASML